VSLSITLGVWCFIRASRLRSLSSIRLRSTAGVCLSGKSWLMQPNPRRLHLSQTRSATAENVHLIFRRLHSQQLRVPLRIFLRLGSGSSPLCGDPAGCRMVSAISRSESRGRLITLVQTKSVNCFFRESRPKNSVEVLEVPLSCMPSERRFHLVSTAKRRTSRSAQKLTPVLRNNPGCGG
jgi:hypothetical protein